MNMPPTVFYPSAIPLNVSGESQNASVASLSTLVDRPDPTHWSSSNPYHRALLMMMVLFHYTIILPLFALCWLALIRWLRRQGIPVSIPSSIRRRFFENGLPPVQADPINGNIAAVAAASTIAIPLMLSEQQQQVSSDTGT